MLLTRTPGPSRIGVTLCCAFLLGGFYRQATVPDVARLTDDEGAELWASWSPDGSRLVFAGSHAGTSAIFGMSADGAGRRLLAEAPAMDRHPRWLDGRTVIFESRRAGNDDVFMVSVDGSNLRQLTDNTAADGAGLPSPDGRHIAFLSQRGGGAWALFVMDRSGAFQRLLATDGVSHAWIPGGSRLVFAGTSAGDLFEADVTTGQVTPLVTSPEVERSPRPSPDGRWLLFTRGSGPTTSLWLKDFHSAGLRQLPVPGGPVEWTTWCGDSRRVVFSAGANGEEDLYAVRISDGRLERLTATVGREVSAACHAGGQVVFSAGVGDALDLFTLTLPFDEPTGPSFFSGLPAGWGR